MKEEDIKKIIGKSKLETSDEFVNTLINNIELKQQKKISFWKSFKLVFISSVILIVIITYVLYKFLINGSPFSGTWITIPKTPIFLIITLSFLYYLNAIIKLNESKNKKSLK